MYIGYNYKNPSQALREYASQFEDVFTARKASITRSLNECIISGTEFIDGKKLSDIWFPSVQANVFISHSSKNVELAKGLAGFLRHKFHIESFIDSEVWDYAPDLLKAIDEDYCRNFDRSGNKLSTYNYTKRNQSTSHVYMMLNMALASMIDRCDVLIFLDTPESIVASDIIKDSRTYSPWIYSELTISRLIEKKPASWTTMHNLSRSITANESALPSLNILHNADRTHLFSITDRLLENLTPVEDPSEFWTALEELEKKAKEQNDLDILLEDIL